jgi:hypothetical protein
MSVASCQYRGDGSVRVLNKADESLRKGGQFCTAHVGVAFDLHNTVNGYV